MLELLRRPLNGRSVVVVATERADGDMHATRVAPDVLVHRQVAATGRPWVMLDEVHGVESRSCGSQDVSTAERAVAGAGDVLVGDGLTPLAVWVADCAPLLLFAADGSTVACHAGWRGLAAGVIEVAVTALPGPAVVAVLGPSVHPCCYEFGRDDLDAVAIGIGVPADLIAGVTAGGETALDVPGAVGAALARHGITLDVMGPCTGCDERWFSHRRGDTGRLAVVGWSEDHAGGGGLS